jgi:hypothetical protein
MIISLMLGIPKIFQVPQLLFLASSKTSAERWVSADMVDFVMSAVSDVEVQSAIRAEERQNVIDEESEIADDRVSYFDRRREHFWKLKIPDLVGLLRKANVKFKSSAHKKDLVVLAVESSILISGQEYPFPDRELLYYDRHGLWKHRTGQKSSKQGKTKVGNMWLDDADLVSDDDDVSACKINTPTVENPVSAVISAGSNSHTQTAIVGIPLSKNDFQSDDASLSSAKTSAASISQTEITQSGVELLIPAADLLASAASICETLSQNDAPADYVFPSSANLSAASISQMEITQSSMALMIPAADLLASTELLTPAPISQMPSTQGGVALLIPTVDSSPLAAKKGATLSENNAPADHVSQSSVNPFADPIAQMQIAQCGVALSQSEYEGDCLLH